MQVVVDNLLVSYNTAGTGKKTILCLHGWGDSSATFQSLASELKGEYYLLMLDLPGFGSSQRPSNTWSVPDFADFVSKFIKKLGVEPYGIIGHSNGGAIAINGLASKNIKAKKLVLLASSGIRNKNKLKKKFYITLSKPAKLALMSLPASTQDKVKRRLYRQIGSDYFVVEHMKKTFKNIVNYDIQSEAKMVDISVLLIYGDHDKVTPPVYGKILDDELPNSKLEIIKGGAHFFHLQQPELTAIKIKDFLN